MYMHFLLYIYMYIPCDVCPKASYPRQHSGVVLKGGERGAGVSLTAIVEDRLRILFLSLSHTHTDTYTHTHSLSLLLAHSQTFSLTHTLTLVLYESGVSLTAIVEDLFPAMHHGTIGFSYESYHPYVFFIICQVSLPLDRD